MSVSKYSWEVKNGHCVRICFQRGDRSIGKSGSSHSITGGCAVADVNPSWVLLKHLEHFLPDVVGERVEVVVERHALRGHRIENGHTDLAPVEPPPHRVQNLTWTKLQSTLESVIGQSVIGQIGNDYIWSHWGQGFHWAWACSSEWLLNRDCSGDRFNRLTGQKIRAGLKF